MIFIYEIISIFVFLLLFPFLFLFPRIKNTVFSRLYLTSNNREEKNAIWFHGASAGDIFSIKPVIELFYNKYKDKYNILVTSNTESGRDIVKRFFPSDVKFEFLPFDLSFSVKNFIKIYKPILLFVESSEFWPILIHHSFKSGARIVLINGNIKKEKIYFYKLLSFILAGLFDKYELLIMRNLESAELAKILGADEKKIIVCTNTKYKNVLDMKNNDIPPRLRDMFKSCERLVVFGSIHYEEEEDIIYVIKSLIAQFSDIKIVLAPRHMERVEPLIKKLRILDLNNKLFVSRLTDGQADSKVLLLDTVGDLFYIYSFATVAFVGGSLTDKGGHNVLEPAVWGVPVITGRFVRNFEDIVKSLLGFGLIVVNEREELLKVIIDLLVDDSRRIELSRLLLSKMTDLKDEFKYIESIFDKGLLV